jgi:acyl carrier protein
MVTLLTTSERVRLLLREVLSVDVLGDDDTDLMESRLVDSLALVNIMAEIEEAFHIQIPWEDLEVDRFRSVRRIADLVAELSTVA